MGFRLNNAEQRESKMSTLEEGSDKKRLMQNNVETDTISNSRFWLQQTKLDMTKKNECT